MQIICLFACYLGLNLRAGEIKIWYNILKSRLDTYDPPTVESIHWKEWIAHIISTTCSVCLNQNGKIYAMNDVNIIEPPLHPNCGCEILPMKAVVAGNGTKDGQNGADRWMKYYGKLPGYYITKKQAVDLGWIKWQGNLDKVAPGKSIGGDVYQNRNGNLPQVAGRVWYEADINYNNGLRNTHRLLFSNDSLIFVTYDHYKIFYEIV